MYFSDEQGEYALLDGALRFSMQGLSNALADVGEGITEPPAEEYIMMLGVMMADCPCWPHPPAFSWNVGMVMHMLKNDPVVRELEHVQVDNNNNNLLNIHIHISTNSILTHLYIIVTYVHKDNYEPYWLFPSMGLVILIEMKYANLTM